MHYMYHVPISDYHRGENRGILVRGQVTQYSNWEYCIGVEPGHAAVKGHFYKGCDYNVPPCMPTLT